MIDRAIEKVRRWFLCHVAYTHGPTRAVAGWSNLLECQWCGDVRVER